MDNQKRRFRPRPQRNATSDQEITAVRTQTTADIFKTIMVMETLAEITDP